MITFTVHDKVLDKYKCIKLYTKYTVYRDYVLKIIIYFFTKITLDTSNNTISDPKIQKH